ncbi:MAG TPA: patatin-like phospholipase family protein [Candidatus Blautia pullicola]|jgi:NTE family protein|uniref:Patatin-like phospholipase family protein n=1 Tax=Candidatus Blautia pullicola TaxID=2838498 RepID=A0A9D2JSA7_9FIRM|nr:patatin-like phospholipase family protein [Candidatus Blautia pullicola]
MEPVIDLTKEYGLVLEGGGAKGAYQIGAWKALREAGVKLRGIAGTSVGALNGALICMDDLEKAQYLWENISYSKIISVEDDVMEQIIQHRKINREVLRDMMEYLAKGGLDVSPLRELIADSIDEERLKNSPIDLYVLTFSVDEMRELDIDMKETEPELIKDYLLASAYLFPLFKNEKLHGKTYIDGGALNNVPLSSLVDRGYEDIIVVRIFGIGREKKVRIPEGTNVYTVAPSVSLGSILDFDGKKAKRHIKRGYFDTMRMLYGLSGKIYYIDEQEEECYYLRQLTELSPDILRRLQEMYKLEEGQERFLRNLTEIILPVIAQEMKLSKDWTYRELYLSMLEATAKMCRISKYKIYTLEELKQKVKDKIEGLSGEEVPAFVQIISKDTLI